MSHVISLEKTVSESEYPPVQTKRILVIEDEIPYARFLQVVMEDYGYKVLAALNAEEALSAVRNEPPDLITLDLMMPDKTGIKLYRELRTQPQLAKTKIVILTGMDTDSQGLCSYQEFFQRVSARGQVAKPDAYLTKPIEAEDLIYAIHNVLEK